MEKLNITLCNHEYFLDPKETQQKINEIVDWINEHEESRLTSEQKQARSFQTGYSLIKEQKEKDIDKKLEDLFERYNTNCKLDKL